MRKSAIVSAMLVAAVNLTAANGASAAGPDGTDCIPGLRAGVYISVVQNYLTPWQRFPRTLFTVRQNNTDTPSQYTVSFSDAETATASFNTSISYEEGVEVIAKVKAQIDAGVSRSKTTTVINARTITLKPHTQYVFYYGIRWRLFTYHRYFLNLDCSVLHDNGVVKGKVPSRRGPREYVAPYGSPVVAK